MLRQTSAYTGEWTNLQLRDFVLPQPELFEIDERIQVFDSLNKSVYDSKDGGKTYSEFVSPELKTTQGGSNGLQSTDA